MRDAKMRRAKEGLKNLGGDKEKMNKSLKRKGTALFVVVLLFMTVMLVPAVSAQEQDDTRAKVPSYIKVYSLVELNTTEILERINAGKSVNISFSGEPFELKLVLNNIRSPDCKAFAVDEDGIHEVELEDPATYKGKVVGDSDSRVRFTITPDWVSGCVVCDKGYYWIDALNGWKKAEAGANITHYTYNTADTEFEIYLGDNVTITPEDEWGEPLNGYKKADAGVNITHYTYNTTDTESEIDLGDDVTLIPENEWDRKRGKSKYYIERQGNNAKVEVQSNFRVYNKRVSMKDVRGK
jgi:hypothetical protein